MAPRTSPALPLIAYIQISNPKFRVGLTHSRRHLGGSS